MQRVLNKTRQILSYFSFSFKNVTLVRTTKDFVSKCLLDRMKFNNLQSVPFRTNVAAENSVKLFANLENTPTLAETQTEAENLKSWQSPECLYGARTIG